MWWVNRVAQGSLFSLAVLPRHRRGPVQNLLTAGSRCSRYFWLLGYANETAHGRSVMATIPPPLKPVRPTQAVSVPLLACSILTIIVFVHGVRTDWLAFLSALLGFGSGMVVGVLVSPEKPGEHEEFTQYAKIGSGFLTGYVVSKVDRLFEAAVATPQSLLSPVFQTRLLSGLSCFCLALVVTFMGRRSWRS